MPIPAEIRFTDTDLDLIATAAGKIAVFVDMDGRMDTAGRKLNTLTRKALDRLIHSDRFTKMAAGDLAVISYPAGLAADALCVVKLARRPSVAEARKAGAQLAKAQNGQDLTVLAGTTPRAADIALGLALRGYHFDTHKTGDKPAPGKVCFMVADPESVAKTAAPMAAVAEGVFFTRDLTNEPANVLTTDDFAARLAAMQELGLDVEILEEPDLVRLGMRTLLAVGQGSDSPSKVVVMSWNGGKAGDAPFALVGKGVVFDTGGISIKPAAGMEEMTMDMGGAGVVAGVMRTLALRKARANVVGIVGLVENMPSGSATRPGDVVRSMKGDSVEIINTDAEGRLVLADVLWYAQDRFKPCAMIDLATLTGAILVALGHENAGLFANDDALCARLLRAAEAEGEGAWRMPLAKPYDALIKSQIADMKNVGGRYAGSITAAQFLQRFVKDDVPWCHLDIAGVAHVKSETALAPAGATGWGVMALNRLIADNYEGQMGAVFFYELQGAPLETTLPMLLDKARGQGWRVLVRGTDPALLTQLDAALWQGPVDHFLPHGLAGGPHDADQPVLLGDLPATDFACVMAVGGAAVTAEEAVQLARACILFDSAENAKAQARLQWKTLTDAGIAAQYWAQEDGRWVKKAERDARSGG